MPTWKKPSRRWPRRSNCFGNKKEGRRDCSRRPSLLLHSSRRHPASCSHRLELPTLLAFLALPTLPAVFALLAFPTRAAFAAFPVFPPLVLAVLGLVLVLVLVVLLALAGLLAGFLLALFAALLAAFLPALGTHFKLTGGGSDRGGLTRARTGRGGR